MSTSSPTSSLTTIANAVKEAEAYFAQQTGPQPDSPATATMTEEDGLRCSITDGRFTIYTDMPTGIGGTATANSPGWHLRAALASCDATLLKIRAARLGVVLDFIQVRVEASSDGRGMLLDDNNISAGSSEMKTIFRVGSKTATPEQIQELVHWVEQHTPVGADIVQAVNLKSEIEIVDCSERVIE